MAAYKDVRPDGGWNDGRRYEEIKELLTGKHSIEVLPDPENDTEVLFRVWFNDHCPIGDHTKLPD